MTTPASGASDSHATDVDALLPPKGSQPGIWKVATLVMIAILVVALVLANVPLRTVSVNQTSVRWFGIDLIGTPQPNGTYFAHETETALTCLPSALPGAAGGGTLSFVWRTITGDRVNTFAANQPGAGLGSYLWLYLVNNVSSGGYSQSVSLACGLTLFSVFSLTNQTVVVQGSYTYNTTVQVQLPLL
jgi:hypothetical protein